MRESSCRMSQGEMDELVQEKDEIIKDLMQEGEKLSKQVLKYKT